MGDQTDQPFDSICIRSNKWCKKIIRKYANIMRYQKGTAPQATRIELVVSGDVTELKEADELYPKPI